MKSNLSAELKEEHEDEDDAEGVEDGGAQEVAEPEPEVKRRGRGRRRGNYTGIGGLIILPLEAASKAASWNKFVLAPRG